MMIIIVTLLLSPLVSSVSNNQCSSCHGGSIYQYLEIKEGDTGNQIPSTLNLNQTATVTVVIQNDVNTQTNSLLTAVYLTLNSAYGHFSVNNPSYYIGDMPAGTTTATWQITGVSDGFDYLLIDAYASNPHHQVPFSDSYLPYPLITVGQPSGTPQPSPSPTPTPAPIPTAIPTPTPTHTLAPTPPPATSSPTSMAPESTPSQIPNTTSTGAPSKVVNEIPGLPFEVISVFAIVIAGTALTSILFRRSLKAKIGGAAVT